MSNSTFPTLHGLVNSTHTSSVHAFYRTGNLPTPWPLVVISSLLSLTIAIIGFKSATMTWNEPSRIETIKRSAAGKSWLFRYQEARDARKKGKPLPYERYQQTALMEENQPPEHELQEQSTQEDEVPTPERWRMFEMSTTHVVVILVSFFYSTARCVIALLLSLKVVITRQGSHSASSSLLLLLLSVQVRLPTSLTPSPVQMNSRAPSQSGLQIK